MRKPKTKLAVVPDVKPQVVPLEIPPRPTDPGLTFAQRAAAAAAAPVKAKASTIPVVSAPLTMRELVDKYARLTQELATLKAQADALKAQISPWADQARIDESRRQHKPLPSIGVEADQYRIRLTSVNKYTPIPVTLLPTLKQCAGDSLDLLFSLKREVVITPKGLLNHDIEAALARFPLDEVQVVDTYQPTDAYHEGRTVNPAIEAIHNNLVTLCGGLPKPQAPSLGWAEVVSREVK